MARFIQVGPRAINLDLVLAAQREGPRLTIYFAAPGGVQPMSWTFTDTKDIDLLWLKMVPRGTDLSSDDIEGGPYNITDNEATASRLTHHDQPPA
jgi:hypothetical protein